MKRTALLLALISFISCDEREKYIGTLNDAPALSFTSATGPKEIKDSIKLSLKNSQKFYPIVLRVADINNNLQTLSYEWLSSEGSIEQDGNKLNTNTIFIPKEGAINLHILPNAPGLSRIVFTAKDKLDTKAEGVLELTGFQNLLPVAKVVLTPKRQYDELDYELNASTSYDRDEKYGGKLERYIFKIGEDPAITSDQPVIRKIFNEKKGYFISIQVQDNDGGLSTVVSQLVDIR